MQHFCLLLLCFFLYGCASDLETVSGNEVPGICRSCRPHMIKGVWYTPQLHYNYDEKGIASWYGPGFHGKQKACGEIFDQHEISAAHKTLPLPTVVRVTNLENSREIDLVVDDRGPYVDGRIIDLSIGAAKELGVYTKGTAKVRVKALKGHSKALSLYLAKNGNKWGVDNRGRRWRDVYLQEIVGRYQEDDAPVANEVVVKSHSSGQVREVIEMHPRYENINNLIPENNSPQTPRHNVSAAKAQAKPLSKSPSYYIDLAAFTKLDNAKNHAREVSALSPAYIRESVQNGMKFYMVRCGPFKSQADAQSALASLDMLGHNPKLVRE